MAVVVGYTVHNQFYHYLWIGFRHCAYKINSLVTGWTFAKTTRLIFRFQVLGNWRPENVFELIFLGKLEVTLFPELNQSESVVEQNQTLCKYSLSFSLTGGNPWTQMS